MKKEKRILSLNRTILQIMLAGYAALLVLLLCMDYYLIMDHQAARLSVEQGGLDTSVSRTAESMEKVRRILYDTYSYDRNFLALTGNLSVVEAYSNAYDLSQTLYGQMLVDEELHGFYIFYEGDSPPIYKVNTDQIEESHASMIGRALQQSAREMTELKRGKWINITVEGDTYLALSYRKGKVELYGIYSLEHIQENMREEAGTEAQVILVDNGWVLMNGELADRLEIVREQKEASDKFSCRKKGYQVFGKRVENTELWICLAAARGFWDLLNLQQLILLIVTGCSVVAVLVLYFFVRRELVHPLRALRLEMERIRNGKSRNIPVMETRFSELKEVSETLSTMIAQLEQQRLLTYEEVIEKQKAQMRYLQLQLKPHFYLNGLKTINALVMNQKVDEVQTLIISLSEHMRYLMQAERDVAPLQQEMDFVDNYLHLQRQITGRKLEFDIEMDDAAAQWKVPVLCVQTFVENSLKYAKLGSSSCVLYIEIRAKLLVTEERNYLDLTVRDNGQGYPEDILTEINGGPKAARQGVGINNLMRRCQILYGQRAEFMFMNRQGAVSECIIPDNNPAHSN